MVAPSADPWSEYRDSTRSVVTSKVGESERKRGGLGWRGGWGNRFRKNGSARNLHSESTTASRAPNERKLNGRSVLNQYERMRAATVSVTVVKRGRDSKWGFGIMQDESNDQVVKIQALTEEGLLRKCPFREGDILKTVNNTKCVKDDVTIDKLVNYDGGIPITLVAESPNGNSKLVQAMARKPSSDSRIGIGFYNINHDGSSLLIINHLAPTGLLAYSALSQGDLVISINGVPCSRMLSDEAAEIIDNSGKTVNILAMRSAALREELNPSFTQRIAKRAMWAAGQTIGAFFTGGASAAVDNEVSERESMDDEISENLSMEPVNDATALNRTETGSTGTGRGSRASHTRSASHEEIALSMMTDTELMDDTISELSFTDQDQELASAFSDDITETLSVHDMQDIPIS
eukprot:scaffold23911_cov127-Cylindrotheca_fusiformis.AAC.6